MGLLEIPEPGLPLTGFSGADVRAYAYIPAEFTKTPIDGVKTHRYKEFGELQTLSITSHRGVFPVRALGESWVRDYIRGCFSSHELIHTDRGLVQALDLQVGDKVLSVADDNSQVFSRVTQKTETGFKPCFKVTLKDGSFMRLTQEHRVLTNAGWKQVSELTKEDSLYVPVKHVPVMEELNIPDRYLVLLAYGIGDGFFGLYKKGRHTVFGLTPGVKDTRIIEEIRDICSEFGHNTHETFRDNCHCIRIKNCISGCTPIDRVYDPFILWTRSLGIYGNKSHQKFIPRELFCMSDRQLRLFLSRLWSTDGMLELSGRCRISYSSTSKTLVKQIKLLLSRLGIHSTIRCTSVEVLNKTLTIGKQGKTHNHDAFVLQIAVNSRYRFLTTIGFFRDPELQERALVWVQDRLSYTREDFVSFVSDMETKRATFMRTTYPSLYYQTKTVSSGRLREMLTEVEWEQFQRTYTFIEDAESLIQTPVSSIDADGYDFTYDFAVENTQNLSGAFVSHNSRTFAGTLMFSVLQRDVFAELYSLYQEEAYTPYPVIQDMLPPMTIGIQAINETGSVASMILTRVILLDHGMTLSIDDMTTETQFSFVAEWISPFMNGTTMDVIKQVLSQQPEQLKRLSSMVSKVRTSR